MSVKKQIMSDSERETWNELVEILNNNRADGDGNEIGILNFIHSSKHWILWNHNYHQEQAILSYLKEHEIDAEVGLRNKVKRIDWKTN